MGNHHSSNQGKYNFRERHQRNCFGGGETMGGGKTNITAELHDDDKLGLLQQRTFRSQSLKHELRCSQKNKFSAFATGKGRRNSVDNFPVQYLRGSKKLKKLSVKACQYSNCNSLISGAPPSTLELLKSPDSRMVKSKSLLTITPTSESKIVDHWSPSIVKVEEDSKQEQVSRMSANLEKFAKQLAALSKSTAAAESPTRVTDNSISPSIFRKYVMPDSKIAEAYLWDFFLGINDKSTCTNLKTSAFIQGAEKIYTPITDKDQISFYVKMYGKGQDSISKPAFIDLLISSYQLSSTQASQAGRDLNNSLEFDGQEWVASVATACYHIKDSMSVFFVSNWILNNLPRLLVPMHKYITHKLTTGYSRVTKQSDNNTPAKETPNKKDGEPSNEGTEGITEETPEQSGIHPILLWFLFASLPSTYLSVFKKTPEEEQKQSMKLLNRMNSRDLLLQLLNNTVDSQKWTLLYDSGNQGLSINRFQFHVFNYRGPTLMFVKCENNYTFLVGIDQEWKESCHFWGSEQCFLIGLKPEFRVVEIGGKSLYANFSIRGYPFGIQVGKDPRNISLEIKPDFEYAYFKKIPCRIISLVVWGCAKCEIKTAQVEHKKWEAKEVENQKKINVNNVDWENNPDKYLLELNSWKVS